MASQRRQVFSLVGVAAVATAIGAGCTRDHASESQVRAQRASIYAGYVQVTPIGAPPVEPGTSPNDVRYCWPRDINSAGVVVGYCHSAPRPSVGAGQVHAFRYQAGGGTTALSPPTAAGTFFPLAINDDGIAAGVGADTLAAWNSAETYDLAARVYQPFDAAHGGATDINGSGQLVGTGYLPGPGPGPHIYRVGAAGEVEVAGEVSGPAYAGWGQGMAIADDGDLAGFSMRTDGNTVATVFTGGAFRDLNTLIPPGTGWNLMGALGIRGGYVVGYGLHGTGHRAFRYAPDGTVTDLGFPGAPYSDATNWAVATAVNARGHAIGAIYDLSRIWAGKAFFYSDEIGHMVALEDLTNPSDGWSMNFVLAINDSDEIVGAGTQQGVPTAFIMKIPALGGCPPPPPAAVGCVAAAGLRDLTTGACSYAPLADGTACDDGNRCTQTDTCQAGVCMGSNPITCVTDDPCRAGTAGICNPGTGVCAPPPALADGTACDDGNRCTGGDHCQAGTCLPGPTNVCTDPSEPYYAPLVNLGSLRAVSFARDINDNGDVVGTEQDAPTTGDTQGPGYTPGFVWSATGGKVYLPAVGPDTFPRGINDAGVVTGQGGQSLAGWQGAFRYDPAVDTQLRYLAPGPGTGVNARGQFTGFGYYSQGARMFRADASTVEILPPLVGPLDSGGTIGYAIADDGSIVGAGFRIDGSTNAVRYSDTRGMEALGGIISDDGWSLRDAKGTNGRQVVGWGYHDGAGRA